MACGCIMLRLTDAGLSAHACDVLVCVCVCVCVKKRENPLTQGNLSAALEIDSHCKALMFAGQLTQCTS